MIGERMPCRIDDGPQTPEDEFDYFAELEDEDAAYEEWRQIGIYAKEQ